MKLIKLHKRGIKCACGCGKELIRLDLTNKINGKYFKVYCGKIYRLHVESIRWIRSIVNG